ncbi:sorbosone dehydrogenase family protein [Granulosicoccus sp.]|nr:sorbosone dehydrogenase family protein [Granulosicoccus sp.]
MSERFLSYLTMKASSAGVVRQLVKLNSHSAIHDILPSASSWKRKALFCSFSAVLLASCGESATLPVIKGQGPDPELPPPNKTLIPTVNIAPAEGWAPGQMPVVADSMGVNAFAAGLDHPRWLHVLPNGDVLVAESNAQSKPPKGFRGRAMAFVMKRAGAGVPSADRITLLRDADGDGTAELSSVFLENLRSPIGMALVDGTLYVANTNAVVSFPYSDGDTRIDAAPETLAELPEGPINHHWTKNLIASADGKHLYVSVGSNSNVAENGMENEVNRAAILEIDRDSGNTRLYASGLRNPVGMDWNPVTGELWTAVNERDEIGSDLVPDYMTSVKDGGFYGWPYSYYGDIVDTRVEPQRPDLVAIAIKPDYALGAHTASLGLTFYPDSQLGSYYRDGAFVAQHGSWNRKPHSGYKVVFVPFTDGEPSGLPEDILSGFINDDEKALGRPVDVATANDGALLVTDDVGNVVWRVSAESP